MHNRTIKCTILQLVGPSTELDTVGYQQLLSNYIQAVSRSVCIKRITERTTPHQSLEDCRALTIMKLLIVLGLVPLLSASPLQTYSYSYDLSNVREMSEILINDLRALNADPNSAKIIRRIFAKNNKQCLKDMNDAILAIQEGAVLLENASGDIQSLVLKVTMMMMMMLKMMMTMTILTKG